MLWCWSTGGSTASMGQQLWVGELGYCLTGQWALGKAIGIHKGESQLQQG